MSKQYLWRQIFRMVFVVGLVASVYICYMAVSLSNTPRYLNMTDAQGRQEIIAQVEKHISACQNAGGKWITIQDDPYYYAGCSQNYPQPENLVENQITPNPAHEINRSLAIKYFIILLFVGSVTFLTSFGVVVDYLVFCTENQSEKYPEFSF